jgi:trimethylamine:corrinoid methyltransferase-like protein
MLIDAETAKPDAVSVDAPTTKDVSICEFLVVALVVELSTYAHSEEPEIVTSAAKAGATNAVATAAAIIFFI